MYVHRQYHFTSVCVFFVCAYCIGGRVWSSVVRIKCVCTVVASTALCIIIRIIYTLLHIAKVLYTCNFTECSS